MPLKTKRKRPAYYSSIRRLKCFKFNKSAKNKHFWLWLNLILGVQIGPLSVGIQKVLGHVKIAETFKLSCIIFTHHFPLFKYVDAFPRKLF